MQGTLLVPEKDNYAHLIGTLEGSVKLSLLPGPMPLHSIRSWFSTPYSPLPGSIDTIDFPGAFGCPADVRLWPRLCEKNCIGLNPALLGGSPLSFMSLSKIIVATSKYSALISTK